MTTTTEWSTYKSWSSWDWKASGWSSWSWTDEGWAQSKGSWKWYWWCGDWWWYHYHDGWVKGYKAKDHMAVTDE
jgi:hypothetical protein